MSNLAAAITRGEWQLNGDAIRVSVSGRLLDGQHRCAAVVQSGQSIPAILVTGLSDDVFATIDRGVGRSTGDVLSIRGDANYINLAAITRMLHIYRRSGSPYNGNPDNAPTSLQQLALVDEHPELHDSARWASSHKWSRRLLTPSFAGFCHFVFTKKDRAAAASFFAGLETGVGLEAGSPVLLLRTRLLESQAGKEKLSPLYKAALVFKAFRLHCDGASLKSLRVRTEGDNAEKDLFVL